MNGPLKRTRERRDTLFPQSRENEAAERQPGSARDAGSASPAGRLRRPWLFLALFLLPAILLFSAAETQAQERRTLLQMLLGAPKTREAGPSSFPPPPPPPRAARPRPAGPAPAPVAVPAAPEPVEKLENARKILVIGDFLAIGLGEGLTEAFEASPGVVVVPRANGSSGLVREDYHDWQTALPALLDEVQPALVIVMIGANDRQQMEIGDSREKFRTDVWLAEYTRRAARMAAAVTERKVPLLWAGLPPFQSPSFSADATMFNRIFRAEAEKAGGEFIDIWDGFADETGKFVTTGSDINGRPVRLRGSDGINLTRAGKRKLAFYLERPARPHLGEMANPDLVRLDADNLPDLMLLPPSQEETLITTRPLPLTDPELDGSGELLGNAAFPVKIVPSPRDLLVERGELPPAPSGRADSASMPEPVTP